MAPLHQFVYISWLDEKIVPFEFTIPYPYLEELAWQNDIGKNGIVVLEKNFMYPFIS